MHIRPTRLHGVKLIELEPAMDERGSFARTFCAREFAAAGLESSFVQHSVSHTRRPGSVRGMHFQYAPHEEVKLVRCIRGAVCDVLIDLRPASPTYLQWEAYWLSADNRCQLYVPAGMAHGFQTLETDCEVFYLISQFYAPEAASGVRHDDPAFGIEWPLPLAEISSKDRTWPDYAPDA